MTTPRIPGMGQHAAMMLHEKLIIAAHASEIDAERKQREAVTWLHHTAEAMGFRVVPKEGA
jgi:hypothetical protein